MSKTYLLLDCPYLCHRAFHAFQSVGMEHDGEPTGVIYGVLRDLIDLSRRYLEATIIFAWDGAGDNVRLRHCPTYKANRNRERTPQEVSDRKKLRRQMRRLRKDVLPSLGYTNIFQADGYEADDLIARFRFNLAYINPDASVVIVAADKDLYQLLSDDGGQVILYDPRKKREYGAGDLWQEWGVRPQQWPVVKAISGCRTDNIPGIAGVAEKTACKYLTNALGKKHKARQAMISSWPEVLNRLKLVELPYVGTPSFDLKIDDVTHTKWRTVTKSLGMRSLVELGG